MRRRMSAGIMKIAYAARIQTTVTERSVVFATSPVARFIVDQHCQNSVCAATVPYPRPPNREVSLANGRVAAAHAATNAVIRKASRAVASFIWLPQSLSTFQQRLYLGETFAGASSRHWR